MEAVAFFNKWLHLLSIITVLGTIFAMRFVVIPVFPDPQLDETDAGKDLRRRYGIVLAAAWVVALLTGFFNLAIVSPHVNKAYHMVVGMKAALALAMFALTMLLGHPIPALERMQKQRALWLTILLVCGIVLVGISAQLNISRVNGSAVDTSKPGPPAANPAAAPAGSRP